LTLVINADDAAVLDAITLPLVLTARGAAAFPIRNHRAARPAASGNFALHSKNIRHNAKQNAEAATLILSPLPDAAASSTTLEEFLRSLSGRVNLAVDQYPARILSTVTIKFPRDLMAFSRELCPLRFFCPVLFKPEMAFVVSERAEP
jgi:endonuclease/exonuclease/phosphatase (EEP) superfamily protein YafD